MGVSLDKQESITPDPTTGEMDWENFDNASWANVNDPKSKADLFDVLSGASEWATQKAAASGDQRAVADPNRFREGFGQFAVRNIVSALRESLTAQKAEIERMLAMSDAEIAGEVRIGANSARTAITASVYQKPESFQTEGVYGSVSAGYRLDKVLHAPFLTVVPAAKKREK